MCGICGLVSLPADKSVGYSPTQGDLSLMLEKLTHRGPQGAGVHSSGAATFGTQRLAIRGLDDGLQPIIDEKTGVIVVCNGEIDNHNELRQWFAQRGRTVNQATDVAVLPAMYLECGEAFVEKLEGVFAIALWDPRSEKLILARDRAGERSLFYKRDADVVSFATEVAALAAGLGNDLAPDKRAIAGYLERGSFTAPTSPFLNIKKVRPGEIIVITNDDIRARRYWTWPVRSDNKRQPAPDEFDAIFKNAIRQQSDVDVDFGLFMSGGLDSSLVAAVAKQVHPNYSPPCYTLRFADKSYDEGDFAKEVAQKLGLEMISVPVGPEDFIKDLPRLVRMVGEPLADPAWIPTAMLSQRAAKDVRIVLTGEGADELFGGYPTYLGANLARYYERLPKIARTGVARIVNALPHSERKMPLSYLIKRFVEGEGLTPLARHALWTANIKPELLKRLGLSPAPVIETMVGGGSSMDQTQLYDLEASLAEGLLTKADRGGMSASLELRAPFLDRAVMEFAAGLPDNEKVRGVTTKYFLKNYAALYLPENIVHRRKRGLSVPLAAWLRGPMLAWAENKLEAGRLEEIGVNAQAARELLNEHVARQADHAKALWTLLVLDEWLAWRLEEAASQGAH